MVYGGYELFEAYNTGDDSVSAIYTAQWRAQTFTPQIACKMFMVRLKVYREGNPGDVTLSLRATDADHKPTGSDLVSATVDGGNFSLSPEWEEFTFSVKTLMPDTEYALVLKAPDGGVDDLVDWRRDITSPTYTRGAWCSSADSGVSWTRDATKDFMFEIWGNSIRGVIIDSQTYDYERGSYRRILDKVFETSVAVDGSFIRQEGGFDPEAWEMDIICTSRTQLDNLSGSYIKTTPDADSETFHQIPYVDNLGRLYTVYFDDVGNIEPIDRRATIFRVPVRLARIRYP